MTFGPLAFVPLQRGSRDTNLSGHVHRLQGWLALHGYACTVDGDFGPETDAALRDFKGGNVAEKSDLLTLGVWRRLTAPLARAMEPLQCPHAPGMPCSDCMGGSTFGDVVAKVARQWLAQSVGGGPLRELPGNSGPVVEACTLRLAEENRLPCFCGRPAHDRPKGEEALLVMPAIYLPECRSYAPDWRLPWCAGWVSTVLRQACESLGVPMPIQGSLSCDELTRQADNARILWEQPVPGKIGSGSIGESDIQRYVKPGDFFLVRRAGGGWHHCGVVLAVVPPGSRVIHAFGVEEPLPQGGIRTAEGNTNKDGGRNGDRLLERVRPLTGLDFICWRSA